MSDINDTDLAFRFITTESDLLTESSRLVPSFSPIQAIEQLCHQYFDERLREQIASGCKQIVMLGTELDTYTVRLATPNVHYFKVEAAILQHKSAQLPLGRSLENITYITGNYLNPNLIELLKQHQFDVRLPTYFILTGSISSLKRGDIIALIDTLRNQVRQFQLSFDYLSRQVLNRSINDPELNQTLDRLEQLGISWITVFKDIAIFTRGLGLELLDTCSIAQLHERYCPQSTLPSNLLQFYRVCTIAKPSLTW